MPKFVTQNFEVSNICAQVPNLEAQYHVNKASFSMNMKGTVYQPRVLQLNLDNINGLPHSKYPNRKKMGNLPARESNP